MLRKFTATPTLAVQPFSQLHGRDCIPHWVNTVNPHRGIYFLPIGESNRRMLTISEVRRTRLEQLVKEHGSMANLCQALGYARNDAAKLARITNGNVRHERGGKAYNMGDSMARSIEEKLSLERGWMDNLPLYDDPAVEERIRHLHKLAEELAPYQVDQLIKIGATLAEHPPGNGTLG